jgi:hypothetical protein
MASIVGTGTSGSGEGTVTASLNTAGNTGNTGVSQVPPEFPPQDCYLLVAPHALDIWGHVAFYIDPEDIVALRKVRHSQ